MDSKENLEKILEVVSKLSDEELHNAMHFHEFHGQVLANEISKRGQSRENAIAHVEKSASARCDCLNCEQQRMWANRL